MYEKDEKYASLIVKTFVQYYSAECHGDGDGKWRTTGDVKRPGCSGARKLSSSHYLIRVRTIILRDNSMSPLSQGVTDVPGRDSELNMSIVWPLAQFTDRERGAGPATENGSSFYAPF